MAVVVLTRLACQPLHWVERLVCQTLLALNWLYIMQYNQAVRQQFQDQQHVVPLGLTCMTICLITQLPLQLTLQMVPFVTYPSCTIEQPLHLKKGEGSMPAMFELFLCLYSKLFSTTFEVSLCQCCTDNTIQSMEQMYTYVCSLVMFSHFGVINEWTHSVCTVPIMNATTCVCVIMPEREQLDKEVGQESQELVSVCC